MKNFNKFRYNKHNPSVNDWLNSIYNFNIKNLNVLWSNKITYDILNTYFNIKNNNSSTKPKNKFRLKRIFVSLPEIKNSLNNINISVYIFNKEKLIINKNLTKLQNLQFDNKLSNNILPINNKILSNENYSNTKNLDKVNIINGLKLYVYSIFKNTNLNTNSNIVNTLHNIMEYLQKENNLLYQNRKKKLIKVMKKKYYLLFLYKCYITRLYFNKLKFNSINLFNLSKIFKNIYDKRVIINIINLKYLHLDNSIFIDAIVRKLKKRNSKILKVLRKALILPKIPTIDSMFLLRKKKEFSEIIYNIVDFNINNNISKSIFESLKNIHLIGVRLEGKGRLTKRLTASRAIYKKAYVGSLKNIYSSSKTLSALMSRGSDKSNLNYINLNSYNRNGSFGIKSWHNTM